MRKHIFIARVYNVLDHMPRYLDILLHPQWLCVYLKLVNHKFFSVLQVSQLTFFIKIHDKPKK